MQNIIEGKLEAKGKKFAVVVARFNDFVTKKLLEGTLLELENHGVKSEDLLVVWVPGAFEIPFAVERVAEKKQFDAIICLGALIRGETPHFDYIAQACSRGILEVGQKSGLPVIFGVLTTDTVEQALARVGGEVGHKGMEAALAAIEMVDLFDQLGAAEKA